MDPNANLMELLSASTDADRESDLIEALGAWLAGGGFAPTLSVCGGSGEDYDTGRVVAVTRNGLLTVAWDGGACKTDVDPSNLSLTVSP